MIEADSEPGDATPAGMLAPLLTAAAALGLFDALVTVLGRTGLLIGPPVAALAAGAFLLSFGAALAVAGPLVALGARSPIREPFMRLLCGPWLLLGDCLLRPAKPAGAAALHRAWRTAAQLAAAFAALALVARGSLALFNEPSRISLFIAGVGLLAVLPARAWIGAAWDRLVPVPAVDGGRRRALLVRAGIAALWLPPLLAAGYVLARRHEVFGAIDPWPFAGVAFFFAALGLATTVANRRRWRRLRLAGAVGAVAATAGIVLGPWLLSSSAPVQLELQRGPGLSRVLHLAAMELLDMDRDGHPWLLGGDCHPLDPRVHPLAEEIPGSGRDEDCDGVDGPPIRSDYLDPLRDMGGARTGGGGILLVVIDSARADGLSLHGYHRSTSPNLDSFARDAIVFERFFAVGNHTALTMPAISTGRYSSSRPRIREINWHAVPVSERERPLPLRLVPHGFSSVFVPGHFMRAFLTGYDVHPPRRKGHEPARNTAARALDVLRRAGPDARLLLGVHFMGPHHPYRAPEGPTRFGSSARDRFDAELAHVDEALAPLLELMQRPGFDRWLVVVTADHGEAFGEHGTPYHGHTLHDEEVRVPLVLRVPGVSGRRERTPAGHLDLAPTMLDWATGGTPPELPGASLLPLGERAKDDPPLERLVFSESFRRGDMYAVRDGRRTLILHPRPWLFELYDSIADPHHRRDLYRAGAAPDLRAALLDHAREASAAIEGRTAR